MLELTQETIENVYETLKAAMIAAYEMGEGAILAKTSLEAMRMSMLMTGEISGKNEAEREAKARQLLDEKYSGLEQWEAEARRAKAKLDVARLDVEMVRAQLRLAELVESGTA